jgi:ribosomal protein S18 acetylase RimI-like enzyme
MADISYSTTDERGLELIGPLWEKLNEYHRECSPHHKNSYAGRTFQERRRHLVDKSRSGKILVDMARDGDRIIGYCVSTVSEKGLGEIDSIYIEAEYRRRGIGDALMKRALGWMDGLSVKQRVVEVASGNEETFLFYRRYGFYQRCTILSTVV